MVTGTIGTVEQYQTAKGTPVPARYQMEKMNMRARFTRMAAGVLLLVATMLGVISLPDVASAGLSGCRADPVVSLTDGTQIQMEANIDTSMSDVQSILYIVHAPVGSRVLSILYTDSLLGLVERVVFYADAPPGQYSTTTVVYTGRRNTDVRATSRVVRLLGLDAGSASGRDRERLSVLLDP